MKILAFVFCSDHNDEVDNFQLASLLEVIEEKVQKLANSIDTEILKQAN